MKKIVLIMLTFISLNVLAQIDRPLSIKIDHWLDTLKKEMKGEQWKFKTSAELLNRKTSPYFKKHSNVYQMDIPMATQRRPTTLLVADLSSNNIEGIMKNSLIWTWNKKQGSYNSENGIFAMNTDLIFSYNKITEVKSKLIWGDNYVNANKVYFDHNKLTNFDPIFKGTSNVGQNGAIKIRLNNNLIESVPLSWRESKHFEALHFMRKQAEELRIENNLLNFIELKKLKKYIHIKIHATCLHKEECDGKKEGCTAVNKLKFTYSPQLPLGKEEEIIGEFGQVVSFNFELPDPDNQYYWELNGTKIPLSDSKRINFELNTETAGILRCVVTNPALPELKIYSKDKIAFINKTNNIAPSTIILSNSQIPANSPQWSIIGKLGAEDANNDKVYFRLKNHNDDNSNFRIIDGNTLVSSTLLFENTSKKEYIIDVQAYDIYGGITDKQFTITKGEASEPIPTAISIDHKSIDENEVGKVGKIILENVDEANFTCSLNDEKDNRFFKFNGFDLETKIPLNYEKSRFYTVRFKVSSKNSSVSFSKDVEIEALNINDTPNDLVITKNIIHVGDLQGTYIGTLVATDDDPKDILFKYEIDSDEFAINNENQLRNKVKFNSTDIGIKNVKIKVTDPQGASGNFTLKINVAPKPNASLNNIVLSNTIVDENFKGQVANISMQKSGSFEYKLVTGTGSDHNEWFKIVGKKLNLLKEVDREKIDNLKIRIQAGNIENEFIIKVNNINETPTGIGLNNFIILEEWDAETEISRLFIKDPDNVTASYELLETADKQYFKIENDVLLINTVGEKSQYNIKIKAIDLGGKSVEQDFTIYQLKDGGFATGVEMAEATKNQNVVFPNPAETEINIKLNNQSLGDISFDIYNLRGQKIMSEKTSKTSKEQVYKFNVSSLKKGVYLLRIISQNYNESTIFLKK